jgi:hypothetical protein
MAATETSEKRIRKDGKPYAKPTRGVVTSEVMEIAEVPKFARQGNGTRTSGIDTALDELAKTLAPGKTVCIRQYEKRESANGTLYNLRHRYNDAEFEVDGKKVPNTNPLKGVFEFNVGPLDEFGKAGQTGLFVTKAKANK